MSTQPSNRTYSPRRNFSVRAGSLGLVVSMALVLGACGTSDSTSATTPTAPSVATSTTAPETAPEETPSPTAGSDNTGATETTAAAPTTGAPGPELCTAADLTGGLDDSGGGAAGHIYMKLTVTNSSEKDCIVDGYPGVSLVLAGSTEPIGAPADRDADAPSNGPITLAPGQGATAVLRYTQAGNYQDCQPVDAASVLVYPPSATDSLEIAHPLTACSNEDIKLLTIGAFQP